MIRPSLKPMPTMALVHWSKFPSFEGISVLSEIGGQMGFLTPTLKRSSLRDRVVGLLHLPTRA